MSDASRELEWLRRAFASRRDGTAFPGRCPAPETLWSAVHGELPPQEVRLLATHLLDCAACAEAWRLAREVDVQAGVGSLGAVNPAGPRRSWAGWRALAAGMAAAAVALAIWLQKEPPPRPGFREGMAHEIRSLVPESLAMPRSRCVLRWSAGPQNASYGVQVATEALQPIAEARGLSATEYLVPQDRLTALPSGTRLLWRVERVMPDGTRVASATFLFRLD